MAFWLDSRQTFVQNWCKHVLQTFSAKNALQAHRSLSIFPHCTNIAAQSLLNKIQSCADSLTSAFSLFTFSSSLLPPSISSSSRPKRSWWPSSLLISYQNPHHYFAKRSLTQFSLTLIHSPSPSLQLSIQSDARVRFVNAHYPFISKKATIGQ